MWASLELRAKGSTTISQSLISSPMNRAIGLMENVSLLGIAHALSISLSPPIE